MALAACWRRPLSEEEQVERLALALTRARSTFMAARWLGELARHIDSERAHEIVRAHADDPRVAVRYLAVQLLVQNWPVDPSTEPLARAFALDPRGPLSLRATLLHACRPRDYAWLQDAIKLFERQSRVFGS